MRAGVFGRKQYRGKWTMNIMADQPDNVVPIHPGWTPPVLTRIGGIDTPADGQPAEVWINPRASGVVVFLWPSDESDTPDDTEPFAWALDPSEAQDLAGLLLHAVGRLADTTTPEVRSTFFPPRPDPGKYPTNPA
jgi:hypothetical protein